MTVRSPHPTDTRPQETDNTDACPSLLTGDGGLQHPIVSHDFGVEGRRAFGNHLPLSCTVPDRKINTENNK